MQSPIIGGLSHAALRTRDIEKTARFYREALGLPEAFRMAREDGSVGTIYLYFAPGQYLELFPDGTEAEAPDRKRAGFCHLCLMTRDIHKAYAAVREAGGPLDSEIRRGKSMCLMFWTHDPDGTQIEIMEMPPESLQAQADERLKA